MKQGGFTMIEILISLTVFSISLLAIAGMVATGEHEFGTAEKTLLALQSAKDRMERLRGTESDFSGEEISERGILYIWGTGTDVPEADLSTLTVTASWTDQGRELNVRLIRLRQP